MQAAGTSRSGGDKAGRIRRARRNRQSLARGWREINRWGCGRIWQDMGVGKDEDVPGDSHVSSASTPPEDDWGATKTYRARTRGGPEAYRVRLKITSIKQ